MSRPTGTLTYTGRVTQPEVGRPLGHDELGRPYVVDAIRYDEAANTSAVDLRLAAPDDFRRWAS
ncbi:MAG: hypothetical protein JWM93_2446 [Frankiales bacterium]|nr:hypothetical protein [Frankiales bacterium]